MKQNEIENVIIFDGKHEYSKDEILKDSELTIVMNSVINLGGFPTLIEKINEESGLLYITTDLNHSFGTGELKNVSQSLYSEYLKTRP